ncbi:MAG TPA: HAD family hydrolase [Trueperaceae bacterium]
MTEAIGGPRARLGADRPPAVGFDLDGVLIRNPFETCVLARLAALLKATPGLKDLGEEEATRAVRRRVSGGWQRRMDAGDLVGAYDWDAIYREVAAELGGAPELAGGIDVARWVEECCCQDGHIAALPGAREALAGLAALGARLVVVTNGFAAYQEPVLDALGLLPYFEAVLTPERTGAAKPQPGIFMAAGPLDLFVGDTLVHDVLGARSAGVAAAWLHPRLPPELERLSPRERALHPLLPGVVERSLGASPHARFHPEADARSCRPDYVLARVDEVVDVVAGDAARR